MKRQILLSFAAFFILAGCATTSTNEAEILSQSCGIEQAKSPSCAPVKVSVVGTYKASLPCDTCSGIEATLTLEDGGKFRAIMIYSGKQSYTDTQKGSYSVFGDKVTTTDEYKEKVTYQFDGENLIMLRPNADASANDSFLFKRVK